jgi:four helix bundle protein
MKKIIKSFENLEAWQNGHTLVLGIYKITKKFPTDELYGLISQLRRAAVSITSNIAEGFSRYHYNDKIRFYHNSRGSVSEVKNCLILSRDLSYITQNECNTFLQESEKILRMLNGLIRSIERQK